MKYNEIPEQCKTCKFLTSWNININNHYICSKRQTFILDNEKCEEREEKENKNPIQ